MRIVGKKDLKNQLSEYVKAVTAGKTVLVTDRSTTPGGSLLADGVRQGWVTPPPLAASGPPPRRPGAPLDDIVANLREDRDAR